jgi:hypothetical protein
MLKSHKREIESDIPEQKIVVLLLINSSIDF